MGIEILTRGAKKIYEQFHFNDGRKQLHEILFPLVDEDLSETFLLDRFLQNPYAAAYRETDAQSVIREFLAGEGTSYKVPHCSEKTPLPESLRGVIAAGVEATAPITQHTAKVTMQIVANHVAGQTMTKNKQALDVIRTGNFYAYGVGGKDLNVNIEFNRAVGNSVTYDFTGIGATMAKAIKEAVDVIISKNGAVNGIVFILGSKWLNQFSSDAGVLAYMQSNAANPLLSQNMTPAELQGVEGLYVLATYRAPNMLAPVFICSYAPGVPYVAYKGAAVSEWLPVDEAIAFPLSAPRYTVLRGMDVIGANETIERVSGMLVFDAFIDKDPPVSYIRANTRHIFVPANIDHTVKSVGTFA